VSYRLVQKLMTLNDLQQRNDSLDLILRYFTEVGSFRGSFCKSGWRYTDTFCDKKCRRKNL